MQAFEASYVAAFTRTPPTTQVEIINVRVSASIDVEAGALPPAGRARPRPAARSRARAPSTSRSSASSARPPSTTATRWCAGQAFDGPAIVEERESTLVVGPGGRFEVAASGNIIVSIGLKEWPCRRPRAASNQPFDAVTLEILWRRTISAVDEAAKALRRTSFSTLVNESNDFACVLTDAAGPVAGAEHRRASPPSSARCR